MTTHYTKADHSEWEDDKGNKGGACKEGAWGITAPRYNPTLIQRIKDWFYVHFGEGRNHL